MSRLQLIETNFESLWGVTKIADSVPESAERYFPIPDFTCPLLADQPVLAISADSNDANPKWRFAGHVKQLIRTGLVVGGNQDTVSSVKKFYLNQISLIWFPNYGGTYQVQFSIPFWLRDITVQIWQYTGPITKTYDQILAEIKAAVTP